MAAAATTAALVVVTPSATSVAVCDTNDKHSVDERVQSADCAVVALCKMMVEWSVKQ